MRPSPPGKVLCMPGGMRSCFPTNASYFEGPSPHYQPKAPPLAPFLTGRSTATKHLQREPAAGVPKTKAAAAAPAVHSALAHPHHLRVPAAIVANRIRWALRSS